ncbi:hypothetical protein AAVH_43769 [Aphelenchoides avenae]|nr:hypothetical protein AAVH_43769 [Aphelenchus avenae]
MAFASGVLYAMNLLPVMYIQDNPEKFSEAPKEFLPYVFSHTFGAFIASTIGFAVYAAIRKNKPWINQRVALPAFFSGILLGVAQCLNFLATESVSGSITYPIGSMLPGCIAALWDVFYFREIKGRRNLMKLSAAIIVTLIGATLVGLSK